MQRDKNEIMSINSEYNRRQQGQVSGEWREETVTREGRVYTFINKGNFYVEMKDFNNVSLLIFQLPRVDIDRHSFFSLFCSIFEKSFSLGKEAGRREFADILRELINYE